MTHVVWVSNPNALRAHGIYHGNHGFIIFHHPYDHWDFPKTKHLCYKSPPVSRYDLVVSFRDWPYDQRGKDAIFLDAFLETLQLLVFLDLIGMIAEVPQFSTSTSMIISSRSLLYSKFSPVPICSSLLFIVFPILGFPTSYQRRQKPVRTGVLVIIQSKRATHL